MPRKLSIQIVEDVTPEGGVMLVTGLRAGHAPALTSALEAFVKAERAKFNNGGTSGVGHAAEDFLTVLYEARGF